MKTFRITTDLPRYFRCEYFILAENEDEAFEKFWDWDGMSTEEIQLASEKEISVGDENILEFEEIDNG